MLFSHCQIYANMAPQSELTLTLRERICELHLAVHWGHNYLGNRYLLKLLLRHCTPSRPGV